MISSLDYFFPWLPSLLQLNYPQNMPLTGYGDPSVFLPHLWLHLCRFLARQAADIETAEGGGALFNLWGVLCHACCHGPCPTDSAGHPSLARFTGFWTATAEGHNLDLSLGWNLCVPSGTSGPLAEVSFSAIALEVSSVPENNCHAPQCSITWLAKLELVSLLWYPDINLTKSLKGAESSTPQ